jgi:phage-related protein
MANRVTQAGAEALVHSTESKNRVTAAGAEALITSPVSKDRVTLVGVEVLVIPGIPVSFIAAPTAPSRVYVTGHPAMAVQLDAPVFEPFQAPDVAAVSGYQASGSTMEMGDGYTEDLEEGPAPDPISRTLNWYAIPMASAVAIEEFLTARAGRVFRWKLPREQAPRFWSCRQWGRSDEIPNATHISLSATFQERFPSRYSL